MPGSPLKRQVLAKIRDIGGWDVILRRIADGETLVTISRDLGVSRNFLSFLLNADPARKEAARRAREVAAGRLAEEVLEIADTATPETERVARLQIETRRWLAARWSPEEYGEKGGPQVAINISDLHLSALRNVSRGTTSNSVQLIESKEDSKKLT